MKHDEKIYDEAEVKQRSQEALDFLLRVGPKMLDKADWPAGVPERLGRLKEGVK